MDGICEPPGRGNRGLTHNSNFCVCVFFRYFKTNARVLYSSAAAFVLVLGQGWHGGQVVTSGLSEWFITLHMLLALFIMMTLIFGVYSAFRKDFQLVLNGQRRKWLLLSIFILIVCTLVQIVLGTQVREGVDVLKNITISPPRSTWMERVGIVDTVHRSFAWLVLISGRAVCYVTNWWIESKKYIGKIVITIFALILLQTLTSIGLYYLGLPRVYQVVHLTGIAFLVGSEFLLYLLTYNANRTVS